jgi:hypothetical protein
MHLIDIGTESGQQTSPYAVRWFQIAVFLKRVPDVATFQTNTTSLAISTSRESEQLARLLNVDGQGV